MKNPFAVLSKFPHPSKKTVLLMVAVAAVTMLLSAAISILLQRTIHLSIPSVGTIKTLGVEAYWDANLTDKIDENEQINWGTLWLGSSNNATIRLKSISKIPITLNLTKNNLIFYDADEAALHPPTNITIHMDLNWNYNGSLINPGDDIQVTLTLSAQYSRDFIQYLSENDIRSFSLDILISTTEYIT